MRNIHDLMEYRRERAHIKRLLSEENKNFW